MKKFYTFMTQDDAVTGGNFDISCFEDKNQLFEDFQTHFSNEDDYMILYELVPISTIKIINEVQENKLVKAKEKLR